MLMAFPERWGGALLLVALALLAVLVRRFAPHARRRLGRALALFGLYAVWEVGHLLLSRLGQPTLAHYLALAAALFQSLTLVSVASVTLFDVVLPRLRIEVLQITGDLFVGIGFTVAAIGVLRESGVNPSSVLTTSAIVSGVLALSLQATLGNIVGGVALQLDGSIHVGDWVQLDNGKQGVVKAIRWRHTILETRDWDTLIVPNATLLASNIQILGKREGEGAVKHRMTFFFAVDFRFAPNRVIDVVNDALRASRLHGIAEDPSPHCLIADLGKDLRDSYGIYLVRYWLLDLEHDDGAQSRVRARVYAALRRADIPLARPVATHFSTALPEREIRRTDSLRAGRVATLTQLDLFAGLPEDERAAVAGALEYLPFLQGEVLARAGTDARWIYLLAEGRVTIRTEAGDGRSHTVTTIDAPDVFGEMGLDPDEKRSADVVALTDVEVYRLDMAAVQRLLTGHPEVAERISTVIAQRRIDILAAREGLDVRSRELRQASEQKQLVKRLRMFFGLDD